MFYMMSFYLMFMNFLSWMFSMYMLFYNMKLIIEWNLMFTQSMKIIYIIYIDWMSLIFISTVTLISSMVIIYSLSYMETDFFLNRFMFLIIIFVISMIFMIISPNFISILLGWDGLGLSSYCLVSYYFNKKSFNSGMITILMNRVGDIMILMMISMSIFFGSWNFLYFKYFSFMFMVFIFICSITKSAQIPFSSWLPMAMAAPTPVSSLVHSSTLVTAGIYLLIRFSYLFNKSFLYFIMIMSLLTMFMAGISAISEFDLKKIIALSTLSQLSIMMMTISLNFYKLSFFHLITHAMFKSLLFLCSGIIIHNSMNNQDIRYISFLNINMPFISMTFNISSFALCGMPFLSGFYSKDLIIEFFLMNFFNWYMLFIMYLSMSLTVMYTMRLIYYLMMKNIKLNLSYLYMYNNLMNYSIMILLILTIFYGSILNWILFSSLNIIFLTQKLKMMIFFIMGISFMMSMVVVNLHQNYYNMFFLNLMIYINLMFFYSNIMKKNKMNLMKFSNYLNFINEMKWLEYLVNYYLYKYFFMIFKFKMIYKMNFMILMILFIYMLFLFLL